MAVTTYWSPNQAAVAQVRQYTFTAPSSVGNTYNATLNGKTVTYSSVSGDTAALVATGLFNLLNVTTGISPEFTEITWTNPSDGVVLATAKVPGTPFAGVTVNGLANQGLVMSTGNGLANGIATSEIAAGSSPSDVLDPQNWLRADMATTPPNRTRAIPVNGDDVVVDASSVPMAWNLDRLAAVQFNTYTRRQSMRGRIGLPTTNPGGYREWRATHFKFVGPTGSVPAGGLQLLLGEGQDGSGPDLERYDVGSQPTTITALAGQQVDFIGVHTANTFTLLGGVFLSVAGGQGEKSSLSSSTVDGGATLLVGEGVTWTAGSTLTMIGGSAELRAAPATLTLSSGAQVTFNKTDLTWTTVTAQGGCVLTWLCGGTITTLTMSVGCTLDKRLDARALTITNHTIDGDTCRFVDPLNAITFTNAGTVKQQVAQGPYVFTGSRTVKVT